MGLSGSICPENGKCQNSRLIKNPFFRDLRLSSTDVLVELGSSTILPLSLVEGYFLKTDVTSKKMVQRVKRTPNSNRDLDALARAINRIRN